MRGAGGASASVYVTMSGGGGGGGGLGGPASGVAVTRSEVTRLVLHPDPDDTVIPFESGKVTRSTVQ